MFRTRGNMAIKFSAFLLLFAFVSLLSDAAANDDEPEQGRKCVSGADYYDGCNWCHCHSGGAISCTYKLCTVFNPKTGQFEGAKSLEPPDSFWEQGN